MKCRRILKLLNRYIDKELLNRQDLELVEEHLKLCSGCKQEFEQILSLKGLISQQERLAVDNTFLEIIKEKIRPKQRVMTLDWSKDLETLSKRLIPVPIVITLIMAFLLFRNGKTNYLDEYLLEDVTLSDLVETNGEYGYEYLLTGIY